MKTEQSLRFLRGGGKTAVDNALSITSTNPVQNAVITECINDMNDSLDIVKAHAKATGNVHNLTLADLGIENVENKSSADIRGELTKEDIIKALGYEPSGGNGGDGTGGGEPSNPNVTIKTFDQATDEEIIQMVKAADAGLIDLAEDCGWEVGQEHVITLPAIAASGSYDGQTWSVNEEHLEQEVTLVLMDAGANQTFDLVAPVKDKNGLERIKPSFIVGLKNCLNAGGCMNLTDTNSGSWDGCARREWCNGGFRQAMELVLPNIFKQFKCITTAKSSDKNTNQISNDFFSLFAEKEILGKRTYSNSTEYNALKQIAYYTDINHCNKTMSNNGSSGAWWSRSPVNNYQLQFIFVRSEGTTTFYIGAKTKYGISPFGCI